MLSPNEKINRGTTIGYCGNHDRWDHNLFAPDYLTLCLDKVVLVVAELAPEY
jgi:hypothetical protein